MKPIKTKHDKQYEPNMEHRALQINGLNNTIKQQRQLEWIKINIKLYINSSKHFLYRKQNELKKEGRKAFKESRMQTNTL